MSECQLVCIPPDCVHLVWPRVAGLIEAAMRRGDLSSFAAVAAAVSAGRAQLWVAWESEDAEIVAAAVTELHQTEWRKVCCIVACGAASHEEHQGVHARLRGLCRRRPGDMARWLDLLAPIEDWASAEGCDAMRIMGRKGWARVLPDYRVKRVVLEKEI
jgi:hypothetical protein